MPILALGQVLRSKSPSDRKGRAIPGNYIETGEGAGFVKVVITQQTARAASVEPLLNATLEYFMYSYVYMVRFPRTGANSHFRVNTLTLPRSD